MLDPRQWFRRVQVEPAATSSMIPGAAGLTQDWSSGWPGWLWWFQLAALVAPLILVSGTIVWSGVPDRLLDGDAALLEIFTQGAVDGEQFTGPYSRFGFNHPGPAYLYLLAPLYALTHGSASSLFLTASLINVVALLAAAMILRKTCPPVVAAWGMLLLALFGHQLGGILFDVWNPWVTILPFSVAMLAFAGIASGQLALLPWAIAFASFTVQSHVGYALVLSVGGAYAVMARAMAAAPAALSSHAFRFGAKGRRVLAASLVLAALFWVAPLWDQFARTGNLSSLVRFFTHSQPEISWGQAWQTFKLVTSRFVLHLFDGQGPWVDAGWTAAPAAIDVTSSIQWVLLALAWVLARRGACPYLASLAVVSAGMGGALILSIHRIVGGLHDYLVVWMTTSGVLCWIVSGGAVLHQLTTGTAPGVANARRVSAVILTVGLTAVSLHSSRQALGHAVSFVERRDRAAETPRLSEITARTAGFVRSEGIRRPIVRMINEQAWPTTAGLCIQLTKRLQGVAVDPQYPTAYPARYALTGTEDGVLLIGRKEDAGPIVESPGTRPVVITDEHGVWWRRFSEDPTGEFDFVRLPAIAVSFTGFSDVEYSGAGVGYRWASASESSMLIPLRPGGAYRINTSLDVRPPVRDLQIFVNQRQLATVGAIEDGGWRNVAVDIPSDLVTPLTTLTFRATYSSPPGVDSPSAFHRRTVAFRTFSVSTIENP